MFDVTKFNPKMTCAWRDHVSHGDIVSFRFPSNASGQPEQRTVPPCLILEIEVHKGQRYALLAVGMTSHNRSHVNQDVDVCRRAEYATAGLKEPTRFIGTCRLLVPLTHSGFVASSITQSAVLGRLNGKPFDDMNAMRCRIHALRDMHTARRRRRSSYPRRGRAGGRDFVVELRQPLRPLARTAGDRS
jgi:hypothetical protein